MPRQAQVPRKTDVLAGPTSTRIRPCPFGCLWRRYGSLLTQSATAAPRRRDVILSGPPWNTVWRVEPQTDQTTHRLTQRDFTRGRYLIREITYTDGVMKTAQAFRAPKVVPVYYVTSTANYYYPPPYSNTSILSSLPWFPPVPFSKPVLCCFFRSPLAS